MTLRMLAVATVCASVSCAGGDAPAPQFPAGFLWGTAIAPYQVEGNLHGDDWYQWQTLCPNCSGDHADDGPDFWDHYDVDFSNAAALGTNAIRMGIDWSRLFPTLAAWNALTPDPAAVQHYHDMLTDARGKGLTVMLTLHHFATPIYLMDLTSFATTSGWQDPSMPEAFARFAGWAAREYGGDVDWWITINEPWAYIGAGWLGGLFPPGKTGDRDGALTVAHNLILGHALAYEAIKANDTVDADGDGVAAMVSFATHNRVFLPLDPTDSADVAAATVAAEYNNRMFLDAVVNGNTDADFNGSFDDPGDTKGDPTLAGHLDFIGLNYYGVTLVTAGASSALFPFDGLTFQNDLARFGINNPISDYGAAIYPEGFRVVLDELRPYDLPIVITENGIADATDGQRPKFLIDHLTALQQASQDGFDIRGYFHWSLLDNFEWTGGFCPEFGLYHVDYTDPARARTAGAGAAVYAQIIRENGVSPTLAAAYPTYPTFGKFCSRTGP